MTNTELIVSLKVPDNVAITAFNTLRRMGYKLKRLERADYYRFDVKGNLEDFKEKISNTDILVNANKNKYNFGLDSNKKIKDNNYKKINILVQDIDNGDGLLSTLRERLGFANIKKLEKGILWTMHFDKKAQAKKIAVDITKNLLMNDNYQKYRILS
jgi:phosphoribosylformylglycinamidine (FGAM) synthase PurS component